MLDLIVDVLLQMLCASVFMRNMSVISFLVMSI